jgi:integrase
MRVLESHHREADREEVKLFLDHGLRCGELAALRVEQIDLTEGTICFDRPRVDLTDQTHRLTPDARRSRSRYLQEDQPVGKLLQGSRKGGRLTGGMTTRAITKRVSDPTRERGGLLR